MAKATGIKTKLVDAVLLGSAIWLIGYIISIILYGFVPSSLLGWILFVLLTPLTVYIAYLRFRNRKETTGYYIVVALVWVILAVVFDYLFIVKALNAQNYYKADVFVYYLVTFLVPFAVGLKYGRD
jgi:hypothetical protein